MRSTMIVSSAFLCRCLTEDRGEGHEKSGGFHQEFVKKISFR
jgi:hypothetical protein